MDNTIPYCGPSPVPGELWGNWNFDPLLIAALAAGLVIGLRATQGRVAFAAGWAVLVLAFVTPLCALTTALFSVRALHHILLISVAAPLLALAVPVRRIPVPLAGALTATVLVLWHVPAVYTAAWESVWTYWLMQLLLIGSAWMLWSTVLHGNRHDSFVLSNALTVCALAGVMGLIGAVLTFSPQILYAEHFPQTLAWGLTPLADQQMAGLIMWVPGLIPFAVAGAFMVRRIWQQELAG